MDLLVDAAVLSDGNAHGVQIADLLRRAHGLDVSPYSESFVASSSERRRQALGGMTPAAHLELLGRARSEAEEFMQSLQIHHSEFFRDPLVFALLERMLLPALAEAKESSASPELRVWSAGCASGEEAYSIAILLHELSQRRAGQVRFRLFATDSSAQQLQLAHAGVYATEALANVQSRHLCRWFARRENDYVVAPELRDQVDFSIHGLLDENSLSPSASIFGEFDLILCCNLLFYYSAESQSRILDKLRRCLAPRGYLVTGEAEREIVQGAGFRPLELPAAIFRAAR